MRWSTGARQGEVIIDGKSPELKRKQFFSPVNISFDHQGNLYINDYNNHQIQCFNLSSVSETNTNEEL